MVYYSAGEPMKRLTPKRIAEEYNQHSASFRGLGDNTGFTEALQQISQAIRDLREAEIDVSLDITGGASEMSFLMFKIPAVVPIGGVLHIGSNQRLFALCTNDEDGRGLKLALTKHDIRHDGFDWHVEDNGLARPAPQVHIYDLQNDPDALIKLQQEIIRFAARNAVIFENDVAEAFEGNRKLRKYVFKPAS